MPTALQKSVAKRNTEIKRHRQHALRHTNAAAMRRAGDKQSTALHEIHASFAASITEALKTTTIPRHRNDMKRRIIIHTAKSKSALVRALQHRLKIKELERKIRWHNSRATLALAQTRKARVMKRGARPVTGRRIIEHKTIANNTTTCENTLTFTQDSKTATCWFIAVMTVFFTSQHMRVRVARAVKDVKNPKKAPIIGDIAMILQGRDRHRVPVEWFGRLRPERFLASIREHAPNVFDDANDTSGHARYGLFYLKKMLDFLEIPHLSVTRLGNSDAPPEYSPSNLDLSRGTNVTSKTTLQDRTYVTLSNPDVIVVLTDETMDAYFAREFAYMKREKPVLKPFEGIKKNVHASEITYGGVPYVLDSTTYANMNVKECSKSHAIAGVTCNDERYMYNGWANHLSGKPCPLMPVDWTRRQLLRLDFEKCTMEPTTGNNVKTHMLFDTLRESAALYVRKYKDARA